MKQFMTLASTAVVSVTVLASIGFWASPQLAAAIKAALVQNVDEPGRNPYVENAAGDCTANVCAATFHTVPGKRLVITNISGYFSTTSGASYFDAHLFITAGVNAGVTDYFLPIAFQGTRGTIEYRGLNQAVQVYVDPDKSYRIQLEAPGNTTFELKPTFTISGYSVALP